MRRIRGFTLLEVMIAFVILASGLLALVTSWSGASQRLKKTQIMYEMSLLLEKKMNELDFEYRGKPISTIPEEDSGDFGESYSDYAWTMSSKKMEFPDLTRLLGGGEEGFDQSLQMLAGQLQQILEQSVKEVKVEVTYKGGKKPISQSLTTLFVDTQFLSGGAMGGGGPPAGNKPAGNPAAGGAFSPGSPASGSRGP
ncbi:MAG: type II secretion system GspH family protein [Bdellovibrionaceae bacterium]|nr:type II secretion system GspH family protein [Pseudobdellovibrionaceae bacterium]